MKNKFIINNNKVEFKDISEQVQSTDVTNVLNHDFDKLTFVISKSELEQYIIPVIDSPPIGTVNININPITSDTINHDLFTNITSDFFKTEPIIDKEPLVIPSSINQNNSTFAELAINYDFGCTEYESVTKLKNELQQTFKNVSENRITRFIYPISNGGNVQYGISNREKNNFTLTCTFSKPTYINTFSLEMEAVELTPTAKLLIKDNPDNLNEICRATNVAYQRTDAYKPSTNVKIYGIDDVSGEQELLYDGYRVRGRKWYSSRWYRMQHISYQRYNYDGLTWSNKIFRNNKVFTTYKMVVESEAVNTLSFQNFGRYADVIQSYQTNYAYYMNDNALESVISDIKQISYRYKSSNNNISGNTILSNFKVEYVSGNTHFSCKVNPLYKWSFKYGDLIIGMNVRVVAYDINNYSELNDSTIIEEIYVPIPDTKQTINFIIDQAYSELYEIETYNIEFELLYDIDKYETLFSQNSVESIKVNQVINNYDYNFKFPNQSTMSDIQPKELTVQTTSFSGPELKVVTKTAVNTVNITKYNHLGGFKLLLKNVDYGAQVDTLIGLNKERDWLYRGSQLQQFMFEIVECDGNRILARHYSNGNNIIEPVHKSALFSLQNNYYPEQLDQSNAITLTQNKQQDGESTSSYTLYNSFYEQLNGNMHDDTRYLIVKILTKPEGSDGSKAYNVTQASIYRALTVELKYQTTAPRTIMVNSMAEAEAEFNRDDVAFYKLDRGVKL